MDAVPQDAFATLGLAGEGGEGLTGLARALLEAGVNEMMAAQADAAREATGTTRSGFRERRLETRVGTIALGMPKLRRGTYLPGGLVERWGGVDRAVICAVAETCALGVSTRKAGRVLERMGADRLSEDAVSRICAALDAEVAGLRPRRLPPMRFPCLWVDATYVPCRRGGHGATAAVVASIAVGEDGVRRVVGPACVDAESYASWKGFLRGLRERGLSGVRCVTSDAHGGIARAMRELFPGAAWQRCVVHLERDVIDACPARARRASAGRVLHAVFDEDDPARVRALYRAARGVISSPSADAGRIMEGAEADALARLDFPEAHRRRIRTNDVQGRRDREIERRARVVQSFPSEEALVRLVGAVCCEASEDWSGRRYMEPSAIEGLWERELLPVPEPTGGQVTRARSRIAALSGIDEGAMAAKVRLIRDSGRRPLHHFSRHYLHSYSPPSRRRGFCPSSPSCPTPASPRSTIACLSYWVRGSRVCG